MTANRAADRTVNMTGEARLNNISPLVEVC